jgi:hypothetical protein
MVESVIYFLNGPALLMPVSKGHLLNALTVCKCTIMMKLNQLILSLHFEVPAFNCQQQLNSLLQEIWRGTVVTWIRVGKRNNEMTDSNISGSGSTGYIFWNQNSVVSGSTPVGFPVSWRKSF